MSQVEENCRRVFQQIAQAAIRCGRDPQNIRLIAVTKTVPPEKIREAVRCGITDIGENRFQEALAKRDELRDLTVTWHFIGHLQTNKAKKVAENFHWIQSVDRSELAEKLNNYAADVLPVLVEVKLHDEPAKSGIGEAQLESFLNQFNRWPRLQLRGFMAVPPFSGNPEDSRPFFRRLRELGLRFGLRGLSMGMSHDFEVAIEEGATMVRVGTALFGQRR